MENRFMKIDPPRAARGAVMALRRGGTSAGAMSLPRHAGLARGLSADQRALVILIENGGIDLGVPELADRLLAVLPQSALIPQSVRQSLIGFLRDTIKGFTDDLIESAELAVNRYGAAAPEHFGSVTVLRNATATPDELRDKLVSLSKEGKLIDLLILTHGSDKEIAVGSGITDDRIRRMRADFGKPLSLRSVYMMNCVGASLNQAWIDAGAKVASGSIRNNYLPEPTTFFFWQNWKQGQGFEAAVTTAYRKTVHVMNEAVRGFVATLLPGGELLGNLIDFERLPFVQDSAPVIQGQRAVTITTDDLSFTQSPSSRMVTTVLSVDTLKAMQLSQAASLPAVAVSHSSTYFSPSTTTRPRGDYSRMQNPAAVAPIVAGITLADAAQVGLGAIAVVQTQVNGSSGSFTLTYPQAQRLLTADARNKMPGARQPRNNHVRELMFMGIDKWLLAKAHVVIEWQGNAYGEIGTAVIRKELGSSSDWTKSSATFMITRLEPIPEPGDARGWPMVFHYEGSYDPAMNGNFEFQGEFEINAFGGLKFNRHQVVSRSFADFAMSGRPDEYVRKGDDVVVATPGLPPEQIEYLKGTLP